MMLKLKISTAALLICFAFNLQAQINQYRYKREIKDIKANWNSIILPNDIFKYAQTGLEDLRIYGLKGKDTVEVPYILELSADQITDREKLFNIINQSKNEQGFFYTFQARESVSINQILLFFEEKNFDWKVKLEGSNDGKEWFTILSDYRILSIINNKTDYQFTQLDFPTAKYSYFRMAIKSNKQPNLKAAKILKTDTLKGRYKDVAFKSYQFVNDTKNKQSIISVNLVSPTPIASLKINIKSKYDYYRAFKIEFATDSFKTDKGIQYSYTTLYQGTLSSLENTEFGFSSTLVSHLKITIDNNDNPPLIFAPVIVKGLFYELIGRFDDPSFNYSLYYGNKKANAPTYELKNFENKVPINLPSISLGDEQTNPSYANADTKSAIFQNKLWLWCLMALIISLLGFFAFKMLKS